jgi:hypothetical protein
MACFQLTVRLPKAPRIQLDANRDISWSPVRNSRLKVVKCAEMYKHGDPHIAIQELSPQLTSLHGSLLFYFDAPPITKAFQWTTIRSIAVKFMFPTLVVHMLAFIYGANALVVLQQNPRGGDGN